MSIQADIRKVLPGFTLDVSFSAGNEALALLGASGCGKSLTLRCIAGIETPDAGRIAVDGVTFFDSEQNINLTPQQRRAGLLFQNYALFPTMTVRENVMTGVRGEKNRQARRARADAFLEKFHLSGLGNRYPRELSGGQQQRAALARIFAGAPRILMLDEPFSALDSHLRWELEQALVADLREFSGTTLFVSHNRDEVYRVCDQIAVYNAGRIEAIGEKKSVFRCPRTRTAAVLTGCRNIAPAFPVPGGVCIPDWGLTLPTHAIPAGLSYAGVRAHRIVPADGPADGAFPYEIEEIKEDPFQVLLMIRPQGAPALLHWEMNKEDYEKLLGKPRYARIPPDELLLLTS